MGVWEALVLGIVQGIAEFLPISSSGHLVVVQHLFGIEEGNLAFAIVLHLGTLLSILIAYKEACFGVLREFFAMCWDIARLRGPRLASSKYRFYILYIIIASVPAGIVGVLFNDAVESAFSSIYIVTVSFYASALILLVGDRMGRGNKGVIEKMGPLRAFAVGIFQMAAIMPGITRSGTTLTGGVVCGLKKEDALEMSFLMAVPAILGSFLLEFSDIFEMIGNVNVLPVAVGFAASLACGIASIALFRKIVRDGSIAVFSAYLIALGTVLVFVV
ncbi:MAG: undecaprenyl-diphosphate phosphatase [Eubacteriaceae bacterium]|jgi:undecaprenyl-diphosphatase|nr:undecaprenyl-diphosphate phosphatase [Eubacteriaceae bacterium]